MNLSTSRDAAHEPARRSIAIVGAGVAGLTAAYLLARRHDVELFESGAHAGGHTHTVRLPRGPDAGIDQLGVRRRPTDMSFSFHCERTGLHDAGTARSSLCTSARTAGRQEARVGHFVRCLPPV